MLKRAIKYIARTLAILACIVIALALMIGFFYGEEMKQLVLKKVNENLKSEIKVGKMDFSLLKHFPSAAVELEEVLIGDDSLLYSHKASCLFNIAQIFSKNLNIQKILLTDGSINIAIDERGRNNYEIWKKNDDPGASSSAFNLEKLVMKNVAISYRNAKDRQRYLLVANDATLHGKITGSEINLKTDADLFIRQFRIDGSDYIQDRKVSISSWLAINSEKGSYTVSRTKLSTGGVQFDINASVNAVSLKTKPGQKTTRLNIQAKTTDAALNQLLSLYPSLDKQLGGLKLDGTTSCSISVTGMTGQGNTPEYKVSFAIENGSISYKNNIGLEKLTAKGFYQLSGNSDEVNITSFKGRFHGKEVIGDLKLTDLQNPYLSFHAKAELDLSTLRPFISHDTLETLEGTMNMNIAFAGKIKDLKQNADKYNYRSSGTGTIALSDVSFRLKKNPLDFNHINGQLVLKENNIEVQALDGNISSTDFHLKGTFKNFISFILLPHQEADIDASLQSSKVNLDELLANKSGSDADTSYKLKFNPRLNCNLMINAEMLQFRRFTPTDIRGTVIINKEIVSSNDLVFKCMNGTVKMDAAINASNANYVLMSCNARLAGLDIVKLFYQMEDFGQATLTHKNLKGRVTADVVFNSVWSSDLVINPAKVTASADLKIENGELNDFKPVLALSKYLKLADLNHIKFSTLQNTVSIKDKKIYIPSMEINSNALNMTVSGVHGFDNLTDYKLKMLLSAVLGKKMKEQNTEFGTVEDDGLGHPLLFLTMKGPADDPKFTYDKKSVAQKIKTDFKEDRQNIKRMIKQEFGKKDTVVVKPKKKEEMQIEWDN